MQLLLLVLLLLAAIHPATASTRRRNRSRGQFPPITEHVNVNLDNCPNGVLLRKEYRDMSPSEWNAFRDALLSIQLSPSPDGGSYSEWDWWTRIHLDHVPEAHEYNKRTKMRIYSLAIPRFFHGIGCL